MAEEKVVVKTNNRTGIWKKLMIYAGITTAFLAGLEYATPYIKEKNKHIEETIDRINLEDVSIRLVKSSYRWIYPDEYRLDIINRHDGTVLATIDNMGDSFCQYKKNVQGRLENIVILKNITPSQYH